MKKSFCLGRKPRAFDTRIPHLSSLMSTQSPQILPATVDWSHKVKDFGMMLNDRLGDCTCAAYYHARQIWSVNASKEITEGDNDVLALYENACGYDPKKPSTDQGGIEQNVLKYLLNTGALVGTGTDHHKITAFFEVDPRNINDIKTTINDCGVCYIGFNVPENIMPASGKIPSTWKVDPKHNTSIGGHAVVLVGYNKTGPLLISWGKLYRMTWEFFTTYTDEAYAIADSAWVNATGKTPLGMDLTTLQNLMQHLKS